MKGNVEGYSYTELWFRGEYYRRSVLDPSGKDSNRTDISE
jgi:hypothetical protein